MRKTTLKKTGLLILSFFFSSALLMAAPRDSVAAENPASQPLKKIAIAYSGISPSQAPAWVAYEQGLFKKYGLDVQLIFIEAGSRTVQTLISGDVAAAQVAGTSVIQSSLQGSGIVLIGGFLNTMDYKLIVARDITRPDQLQGQDRGCQPGWFILRLRNPICLGKVRFDT